MKLQSLSINNELLYFCNNFGSGFIWTLVVNPFLVQYPIRTHSNTGKILFTHKLRFSLNSWSRFLPQASFTEEHFCFALNERFSAMLSATAEASFCFMKKNLWKGCVQNCSETSESSMSNSKQKQLLYQFEVKMQF